MHQTTCNHTPKPDDFEWVLLFLMNESVKTCAHTDHLQAIDNDAPAAMTVETSSHKGTAYQPICNHNRMLIRLVTNRSTELETPPFSRRVTNPK